LNILLVESKNAVLSKNVSDLAGIDI
jgi:hypothetical protein